MKVLTCLILSLLLASVGCVSIPLTAGYGGPSARPLDLESYYKLESSYTSFTKSVHKVESDYTIHRIKLESEYGDVTIDYYKLEKESDSLVFVFPVLGGRNLFSGHFAEYFAKRGIETAIVHRNSDFKNPNNYRHIEEVLRRNVLRDRLAIDLFENEFSKSRFGTFGISRGAINASITAGVDPRLKYNVFALGGADLVNMFKYSTERGIQRYKKRVLERHKISEERFYSYLRQTLKTDPKFVAGHIDARNTLMFLSVFDGSVPFEYGLKLRQRIGDPKTIFLMSGHYTALAFTQFVRVVPPTEDFCVFPLDYVESESLAFYREKLESNEWSIRAYAVRIIQLPVQFVADIIRVVLPE